MTGKTLGGMSELRAASLLDLSVVAGWIRSAELCRQWAGERVAFPIQNDRLPHEIEFEKAESWCLLEGGTILGFGQIVPKSASRQHLARLVIEPESRGQGLGRVLAEHLLELALAKSPSCVSLNVSANNPAAVALYRSLGFRPAERPEGELESTSEYMEHAA